MRREGSRTVEQSKQVTASFFLAKMDCRECAMKIGKKVLAIPIHVSLLK
jgi:hypothetical protein